MSQKEITELINKIWDAVDNSRAGPMVVNRDDPGTLDPRNKQFNSVALNTFGTILGKLIEDHESWKDE